MTNLNKLCWGAMLLLLPLISFSQKIILDPLSTYATGIFDDSGTEIVAYDAISKRLFFTNAADNTVGILDITDPTNPTLINELDMEDFGGGINSVAVANGIVAIALEADPKQNPGKVVLTDTDGNLLNELPAGALPDMIVFTPDGTKILTANEGEPNDEYDNDPEGSVTIIDISNGATNATATQVTFESFNDKKATLLNKGIRIFGPNASVAQDLEPEFITVSEDNTLAYVVLQENNGLAVVSLEANTVIDILPLGYKDHFRGAPALQEVLLNEVDNWIGLGTPAYGGDEVQLGGFSGLYYDPTQSDNDRYVFYTIPDRGPNESTVSRSLAGTSQNLRPFKLPNYQSRIVKVTYDVNNNSVQFDANDQIFLTAKDGATPISGRGNIPGFDEVPVTITDDIEFPNIDYSVNGVDYHALPYDRMGGDFEGILRDPSGDFWMCDEYRPAIYHFGQDGILKERYVPQGTSQLGDTPQAVDFYGKETLPAVYSKRRANRGFEALALDTDEGILYAFIQTPMYNPGNITQNNSDVIRILGIDPATGEPVREYVYLLERNAESGVGLSRVDKIGDAVYMGNGKFLILERDSSTPADGRTGKKYIYELDLTGATNILGTVLSEKSTSTGANDKTLEMMSAEDLLMAGIQPVHKTKVLNLPSIGYLPSDKPEGLALLPFGKIAVLNDNDFGLAGAGVSDQSSLGIISFQANYGFDASDDDDAIRIWQRPTLGMYQPDAIAAFTHEGKNYIVSANEGDARDYDGYSEEERVKDLDLEEAYFPQLPYLQEDESLGRLKTTSANGDLDGDGKNEIIYSYGARSFSVWDENGNIIFDSGTDFENEIRENDPDNFNSSNDDNDDFDNRSDDKGVEPEAITVFELEGTRYVLVGLERMGGIMVYEINDPYNPVFVDYVNNRDFTKDAETLEAKDLGLEDIVVISAEDSPNGKTLIATANEVSGTVTLFSVVSEDERFTLQVLHNNDGESGLLPDDDGFGGVAQFKSVVENLRYQAFLDGAPSILLSSGDNFLAGPEWNASLSLPADQPFYDAVALRSIGYDAMCIGNHEFDFGPDVLADFIMDFGGTPPAFLSANLDFSQEAALQALVDTKRIVPSTVIWRDGQQVGVVGLTTPQLPFISSPGGVVVDDALTTIVQAEVDALTAQGVNKIILVSHLQSIEEEKLLAKTLTDVDLIIAGGGDELLTNNPDNALPGMTIDGAYPLEEIDANGQTVYVVTTPGAYKYVGNLKLVFDENGKVMKVEEDSDAVLVGGAFGKDAFLVNAVENPINNYIAGLASNILGITEVDLDGIRDNVRTKETNQGNLIADALLWQAKESAANFGVAQVDVAIQNGGGIRNNSIIDAGSEISELTTFDMLPFANFVSVIDPVSPTQFKEILENMVSKVELTNGRFGQVAGFSFVYDPMGTAQEIDANGAITTVGARIISATLADGTPIIANGQAVGGALNINIATIDFLARGGDQYPYGNVGFTNLGTTYQQALANYISQPLNGLITATQYPASGEGRITTVGTISNLLIGNTDNTLVANQNASKRSASNVEAGVFPNPFSSELTLVYEMANEGRVNIALANSIGIEEATLFEGTRVAGTHQLRVNTEQLKNGVYFVVIKTEDQVKTISVLKQQ
ncbi:MAG: esterase-like activity of phytase family protein [Bacteroidota bacterium]